MNLAGDMSTLSTSIKRDKNTAFEIIELSQNPELLKYCPVNLDRIIYCGGDLPQSIGDTVASNITLRNQYGASELRLQTHLHSKANRSHKDWK
jgi:hypothetical protein